MHIIQLKAGPLTARISRRGTELISLRHVDMGEIMWQARTNHWRRQSPVLFPLIGSCPKDMIMTEEGFLDLPMHGLAPMADFEVADRTPARCRLLLRSDDSSLRKYPYPFLLAVDWRLHPTGINMAMTVTNPSPDHVLPFMIGAHPGFSWPLPGVGDKDRHRLEIEGMTSSETSLLPAHYSKRPGHPIRNGSMLPAEMDFAGPTHVLPFIQDGTVRFGTDHGAITLSHKGFDHLAFWTVPGADFLCIEPWSNLPIDVQHATPLNVLPNISRISPKARRQFRLDIGLTTPGGTTGQ